MSSRKGASPLLNPQENYVLWPSRGSAGGSAPQRRELRGFRPPATGTTGVPPPSDGNYVLWPSRGSAPHKNRGGVASRRN
jgi:hypothetical protein